MVDVAKVRLYGKDLGAFRWDTARNVAQFEYDPDFISTGLEPSPVVMPVRPGRIYSFGNLNPDTFNGLPGMLADSLPGTYGKALFEKWLAMTGRTSGNPIESLCFLGKRCMGALEFEPAMGPDTDANMKFEMDSLVSVAREALQGKESFNVNIKEDRKKAVSEILRLGTSAGGQRAKAIIAYNKQTGEIRSGQIPAPDGFEYYIIKLDGVSAEAGFKETQNFGRLEYSFALLVKECGIEMSDCSLIEENGRAHFLTKRFDRMGTEKIHMQSLCGIAHYDYRERCAYSYEQSFNIMRRLGLPYSQAQEMFRRIVFNVVMRNQDDHTKNISFLMNKDGRWSLSPAYDMVFAYNPAGQWTSSHQMSVNGKYDNIQRADLLALADLNGIKNASETIDKICDAASGWAVIAKNCGVPKRIINEITPHLLINL